MSPMFWINNVVNLVFLVDLVLQFFLQYQTGSEEGECVRSVRVVCGVERVYQV